jgi:threonine/homoserine/homoserine lactone efflux protein
MNLVGDLLFGLLLGFSLTIPPGPMNALIASIAARSLRGGVLAGTGAMTADLVLGGIVYGVGREWDLVSVIRVVYALGSAVMTFLAIQLLRHRPEATASQDAAPFGFSKALALGLTNPFQIVWWLTAGLAFAYLGGAVLLIGLFGAVAVWIVVFPYAVHLGTRRYPSLERAVHLVAALLLLGFAVYFAVLAVLG